MKRPDFTSVGTRPSVAAVALENHAPARILFCLTAAHLTASSFPPLRHHWLKLPTALSTNDITSVLPIRQQMSWAHGQNPTQGKRQKIPLSGHLALICYVFVISQQYHFFFLTWSVVLVMTSHHIDWQTEQRLTMEKMFWIVSWRELLSDNRQQQKFPTILAHIIIVWSSVNLAGNKLTYFYDKF